MAHEVAEAQSVAHGQRQAVALDLLKAEAIVISLQLTLSRLQNVERNLANAQAQAQSVAQAVAEAHDYPC